MRRVRLTKEELRHQLRRDVTAYLETGGQIRVFPPGASAVPSDQELSWFVESKKQSAERIRGES